uniref:Uncharacterized protein n=1 Tax=Tanacetum cinerariifolium TaxID=118510 RepID=A0A6L2KU98_TANCI|nr:hypothetical protein [Tanacetum cinerariifolium]
MVTRAKDDISKLVDCLTLYTTTTSPLPRSHVHAPRDPNWHKYNADGSLSRYKARLVANGRNQQQGIDCDETFCLQIIASLHDEFTMTDFGLFNYFLGISAQRPSTVLFLSQSKYVEEILERAHMHKCNPCKTLVDTKSKLGVDGDHRIIRCIRRTINHGLQLNVSSMTQLTVYIDVDWSGYPTTRCSTSGYYVFLGDNLSSWSAKQHATLSRFSAEAKYHGVANVVAETAWLRYDKNATNPPPVPPTPQAPHTISTIKLPILKKGVFTEDANQKFLRSLPSSWSQVSLIMRTKPGVDTLSFADLYNNLRVFESDVKGSTASSSSTQIVAFISSDNTNSTNDVSTAYGVSTSSGHNSQKEGSSSYTDDLMYSFFSNQSGNIGYKARDHGRRPAKQDEHKAMVTIDGKGVDWIGHVEDDTKNYALMAFNSSNSGSDTESKTSESDAKTSDLASCESNPSVETLETVSKPVESKPKDLSKPKVWFDAPIIEEYESDSDDEYVFKALVEQEKPSCAFINIVKHVKTLRQIVKDQDTCSQNSKVPKRDWTGLISKRLGLGYGYTRKACFICGSFSHLIRDCDFHEKRMAKQVELNKRKNKLVLLGAIRKLLLRPQQVVIRDPKDITRTKSPNTIVDQNLENMIIHQTLKGKGIVDSGCLRHMTGNKAYLVEYQDFNGGHVAFGGSKGQITGLWTFYHVFIRLGLFSPEMTSLGKEHEAKMGMREFFKCWFHHHTTNGHQFTMSNRHQELASPKANDFW